MTLYDIQRAYADYYRRTAYAPTVIEMSDIDWLHLVRSLSPDQSGMFLSSSPAGDMLMGMRVRLFTRSTSTAPTLETASFRVSKGESA